MRQFLAAAIVAALTPAGVLAQDVTDPQSGITSTIGSQLDAFEQRDVLAAWRYASPGIQRLFGSPQRFAMMVERGYPMVWDPANYAFAELQDLGGQLVQRVQIIDEAGVLHILDYSMVEIDGNWRISGVRFVEAPQVGV